jgi:hypothetical protein
MNDATSFEIRFQIHANPAGPRGETESSESNRGRLPRITQVLALAIHLDEMIRKGEAMDYADLARLGGLCRERVSQIMRLNYLAPDIQVELLYLPPSATGRYPISETAVRRIANLLSRPQQRERWLHLRTKQLRASEALKAYGGKRAETEGSRKGEHVYELHRISKPEVLAVTFSGVPATSGRTRKHLQFPIFRGFAERSMVLLCCRRD